MRRLRHLLFVTLEDPDDPVSWSGSAYELREGLGRHVERLTVLGKLKPKRTLHHAALRALLGGYPARYPLWMTRPALLDFARVVSGAIADTKPDAVLSLSSQCIIYLDPPAGLPVGMFCDAPWLAWQDSYKKYERMPVGGRVFAAREAEGARKCDALFFGSDWAAAEAERLYGAARDRIHIAPLGASWVPLITDAAVFDRVNARFHGPDILHLLFVGKDWERKGGPLAVEIARALQISGQPTLLHIVGCSPELPGDAGAFVKVHGLLHRSDPAENEELRELFLNCHFLVVPTEAECFGLVFAEALAHALPAVSCRVDAVPSIVLDRITGILEDRTTPASVYARRIREVFMDPDGYNGMAKAAHVRYKSNFTWDACATTIINGLEAAMQD